jgi:hypothetical protein
MSAQPGQALLDLAKEGGVPARIMLLRIGRDTKNPLALRFSFGFRSLRGCVRADCAGFTVIVPMADLSIEDPVP